MTTINAAEITLWRWGPVRCVWTPNDRQLAVRADAVTIIEEKHDLLELVSLRSADLEHFIRGLSWAELAELVRVARIRENRV